MNLEDRIVWNDAATSKPVNDDFVLVARLGPNDSKDVFICYWHTTLKAWYNVDFEPLTELLVVKYWAKFPSYPV